MKHNNIVFFCILCLVMASNVWSATNDVERGLIEKRIQPVGQVKMKADDQPADALANEAKDQNAAPTEKASQPKQASGETIYKQHCAICHQAGIAGAPKIGDKGAWADRSKLGIDALLASAIKGKGAMPAKGTCTSCSEAQLKAAIEYMMPK